MIPRLCCLIPALAGFSFAQTETAALDAWLARQATIRSLDTSFIQERKLPALKKPTTSPGRFSFARPSSFRWQLGDPTETLVVSDGATVTLLDSATRTARRIPADSPRAARFALLSGDAFQNRSSFTSAFELVESRIVSGIHQYTLKPKDRRFRSEVPWVFLDIDPKRNELRAMEMELQDKSRVRTVFQNPSINKELPPELFRPVLSGYQVK